MKRTLMATVIFLSAFLLNMTNIFACSAFYINTSDNVIIGKNLDVPFAGGYMMTNQRGILKKSILFDEKSSARWTSIYGSLTVNMLGIGFPMGGINEAGLVIEHLRQPKSACPDIANKPVLLEFEWIQFLLDTCQNVDEVLSALETVVIAPGRIPMHFIIADAKGQAVLIEFMEGKAIVSHEDFLHMPVVTNDWHKDSVQSLQKYSLFGGKEEIPYDSRESLDRFAIVAAKINTFPQTTDREQMLSSCMNILEAVEDNNTILSTLYDPVNRQVFYKTQENPQPRSLSLKDFDYSCEIEPIMLDIHKETSASIPFNDLLNKQSIENTVLENDDFLKLEKYMSRMIDYSKSISCTEKENH